MRTLQTIISSTRDALVDVGLHLIFVFGPELVLLGAILKIGKSREA